MRVHLVLAITSSLLLLGCDKKKKGSGTQFDIPEMEPPVTQNAPSTLVLATSLFLKTADNSPKICTEPDCPTVAATVQSRLFGKEGSSITKLLDTADGRVVEIELRSKDQKVACMEEASKEVTSEFGGAHSFKANLNCYSPYSGPGSTSGGQLLFGKSTDNAYYIVDRYKEAENNVRTFWSKQDKDENVEVWSASYDSVNNNGVVLSHLTSNLSTNIIEFAVAGMGGDGGVDFMCGSQLKMNKSYIYISGKVAAPSTTESKTCDDVASVTYCLNTTDFSESDASNCTSAKLNSFEQKQISPSDITESTFVKVVEIDYSKTVTEFTSAEPEEE